MPSVALLSERDVRDPREVSPPPLPAERPQPPPWTEEVALRLLSFLDLEPDWDSFGASTPRQDAIEAAFELLMLVARPSTPAPQAVPTTDGGVQLEWHQYGIDLEVEVHSPFRVGVLYENSRTGEVQEEALMADLTPLRHWLDQLSE